jgi:uncharacterized repeat protein (TIGR03803 family)
MKPRRSLRNLGVFFLLMTWMTMLLVPGAGAQSKYKSLYKFDGGESFPEGGLIFDQSGNLYGTTYLGGAKGFGVVFTLTPQSDGRWTKSVLYSFCSLAHCADGAYPVAGLVFDQTGNLYGTTASGGANQESGAVFKLAPNADGSWTESVLYSFCALNNCVDGSSPQSSLTFDQMGNLYGTTGGGGSSSFCGGFGCGTVFKLIPGSNGSWTESVLYSFCSLTNCADGGLTFAGVILDGAGNLYGTASLGGGVGQCAGRACGVVFELTARANGSWKEKILHRFADGRDGARPEGSLIFDGSGNLYGTTNLGGNSRCRTINGNGCGVVFELMPESDRSWKEEVLHKFTGADGNGPVAGLVFDTAGSLLGTTFFGGDLNLCGGTGCGVVFELTPNSKGGWTEKVLHRFLDLPGARPNGVILDAAENVFGSTLGDSSTTFGSVFEITP